MKEDKISLWRERIPDKKASGLKLVDWCRQNQLTKHAYYYWKRKVEELEGAPTENTLFVEIPSAAGHSENPGSGAMKLKWKELSICVTDSHSVSLAAELLAKLNNMLFMEMNPVDLCLHY